jgi:hypothetical protein
MQEGEGSSPSPLAYTLGNLLYRFVTVSVCFSTDYHGTDVSSCAELPARVGQIYATWQWDADSTVGGDP